MTIGTPSRGQVGLVLFAALIGAGISLIETGTYGWTIFVLLPVFLGALWCRSFQPQTGGQAALRGALTALVALSLFFLLGVEGAICIIMTAPIALPMGALGGWLADCQSRYRACRVYLSGSRSA